MRNLPSLSGEIFARAGKLADKTRAARAKAPKSQRPPTAPNPENTISPAKVVDGVATLRIYDYIDMDGGYWGISANEVAEALDDVETPITRIELRINSGGGHVWDGLAILNTLRAHKAPVTAIVDGIAASAASFLAVACDEVVMMPNSRMMIHDAMGLCIGQAVDMREYADFLDDTSQNLAEIYAEKAGGTSDEWRARMTEHGLIGTWYSAQDAVDAGLADRVGESSSAAAENVSPVALTVSDTGVHIAAPCPATEPEPAAISIDAPVDEAALIEDQRARFQQLRHAENSRFELV
jgi:ATP-dependent Clp endopeptidase proteolytic subunit ClpP